MIFQKWYPRYSDGSLMAVGDEVEVSYPNIHPIPHRGIIFRLPERPWGAGGIEIVHSSKSAGGVCTVDFDHFSQSQPVRVLRRSDSFEHAESILHRAAGAIGYPYHTGSANCEHFTDWCYNGISGESPTLQKGVALAFVAVVGLVAFSGDPR